MSRYFSTIRVTDMHRQEIILTRCSRCVCFVAEVDTAAHDAWHELVDMAMGAITRLATEIDALNGPLVEIGDPLFNEDGTAWKAPDDAADDYLERKRQEEWRRTLGEGYHPHEPPS